MILGYYYVLASYCWWPDGVRPFLPDELDHVEHLDAGDVLDGEVDERGDDAGEEADEERQGPFEEDVLQHLRVGPAPPVVLEQIVLDDPE